MSTDDAIPEAIRREQMTLIEAIARLEENLGDATVGRMQAELLAIQRVVRTHFAQEESGFLRSLRAAMPEREADALALEADHDRLRGALQSLLDRLTADTIESRAQLDEDIRSWIRAARDHEAQETHLLQETFQRDIGAAD